MIIIIELLNQLYYYQTSTIGGDSLTTGVHAQLITANDGVSLLGIRVSWTIKSEYFKWRFDIHNHS